MTRYSRKLSPKVFTEHIPYHTIFIDTETKVVHSDDFEEKLELLVACFELWLVDDKGLPVVKIDNGVIREEHDFYSLIKSYAPCRVVAHNWRFDATILRIGARENLNRYEYNIDVEDSIIPVEAQGFTPFVISLDFDGKKVELLCNTNYYKQSLDSLGESFGTEKGFMPKEEAYENYIDYYNDLVEYCERDVEILRESYFYIFKYTQELAQTTPGLTVAMSANRVYRTGFMPKEDIQGSIGIPYLSEIEQEAYKGGRTDALFLGNPDKEVYKYDVNSLYPYSMLGDIPIRYNQIAPVNMVIDWLDTGYSRFIYLCDVTIKIDEEDKYSFIGGEGVRTDEGQLLFPIGEYRIWVWQPMVKTLYDKGYIKEIHKSFCYDKAPIFDDYVTELYSLREQYKKSGDKARDLLVKILLNSLYGKFGQRQYSRWEAVGEYERSVIHRESYGIERYEDMYDNEFKDYLQIADQIYSASKEEIHEPSINSVMSIAGYITTMARSVLWEAMASIIDKNGELYYCDTDSIFTNIKLPKEITSQTELGKWALEDTIPKGEAEFIAPKHYRIEDKWTIKGIRNPEGNSAHLQIIFPNFITDLTSTNAKRRERLETGGVITKIVKNPTGLNSKRMVGTKNEPTYPYIIA